MPGSHLRPFMRSASHFTVKYLRFRTLQRFKKCLCTFCAKVHKLPVHKILRIVLGFQVSKHKVTHDCLFFDSLINKSTSKPCGSVSLSKSFLLWCVSHQLCMSKDKYLCPFLANYLSQLNLIWTLTGPF